VVSGIHSIRSSSHVRNMKLPMRDRRNQPLLSYSYERDMTQPSPAASGASCTEKMGVLLWYVKVDTRIRTHNGHPSNMRTQRVATCHGVPVGILVDWRRWNSRCRDNRCGEIYRDTCRSVLCFVLDLKGTGTEPFLVGLLCSQPYVLKTVVF
jgi:hypothetical protein